MTPKVQVRAPGMRRIRRYLQIVGEGCRVLEGVRRVGVEEAAAVGPQFLDRLLGSDRPHRNGDFLDRHPLGHRVTIGILKRASLIVHHWFVVAYRLHERHRLVGR